VQKKFTKPCVMYFFQTITFCYHIEPFFCSWVDGPIWVFFCMMFFVMCNVFINDRISITSQGSSCFTVLCGLSLSVAIVWRAQSGNVFLFLIGDVHSSHGVLVTNFCTLWQQGLNKSFKIIFPFCLFLVCPDAPRSQIWISMSKFLDQRGHSISNCQGVYNSLRELLRSDQVMSWSRFYMGLIE